MPPTLQQFLRNLVLFSYPRNMATADQVRAYLLTPEATQAMVKVMDETLAECKRTTVDPTGGGAV